MKKDVAPLDLDLHVIWHLCIFLEKYLLKLCTYQEASLGEILRGHFSPTMATMLTMGRMACIIIYITYYDIALQGGGGGGENGPSILL